MLKLLSRSNGVNRPSRSGPFITFSGCTVRACFATCVVGLVIVYGPPLGQRIFIVMGRLMRKGAVAYAQQYIYIFFSTRLQRLYFNGIKLL